MWRVLLLLLALAVSLGVSSSQTPNVIFITMSSGGWYDFHEDPDMPVSNLRALKADGVFLNQSYSFPLSPATKAAWMTGRYPHTFGLQSPTLAINMNRTIDVHFTFLAQEFKNLDYTTHMVGKWNLGFCHPALTPKQKGFDTFYGSYAGVHDSTFDHTKTIGDTTVYDWMDGESVDLSANGKYETDLMSQRAVQIINERVSGKPFYLHMTFGEPVGPMEVPGHYKDEHCSHITDDEQRKMVCAKIAALDAGVGAVVRALKDRSLYDQTIILFTSDSGAKIGSGSLNYPLRGVKTTLFEGGIRSFTILKGDSWCGRRGKTWSGLAFATDWFPTLLTAAGGQRPDYAHGKNLYQAIKKNKESPRKSFVIVNDHFRFKHTLVRYGQWKMMKKLPEAEPTNSMWTPGTKNKIYPPAGIDPPADPAYGTKLNADRILLFNLDQDPEELNDVYNTEEMDCESVKMMEKALGKVLKKYPLFPLPDPRAIQTLDSYQQDGFLATCWCQPEGVQACTAP